MEPPRGGPPMGPPSGPPMGGPPPTAVAPHAARRRGHRRPSATPGVLPPAIGGPLTPGGGMPSPSLGPAAQLPPLPVAPPAMAPTQPDAAASGPVAATEPTVQPEVDGQSALGASAGRHGTDGAIPHDGEGDGWEEDEGPGQPHGAADEDADSTADASMHDATVPDDMASTATDPRDADDAATSDDGGGGSAWGVGADGGMVGGGGNSISSDVVSVTSAGADDTADTTNAQPTDAALVFPPPPPVGDAAGAATAPASGIFDSVNGPLSGLRTPQSTTGSAASPDAPTTAPSADSGAVADDNNHMLASALFGSPSEGGGGPATSLFDGPLGGGGSVGGSTMGGATATPPAASLFGNPLGGGPAPAAGGLFAPSMSDASEGPYGFGNDMETASNHGAPAAGHHPLSVASTAAPPPPPPPSSAPSDSGATMEVISKLLQQERAQLQREQQAQQLLMMQQFETMMSKMVSIADKVSTPAVPPPAPAVVPPPPPTDVAPPGESSRHGEAATDGDDDEDSPEAEAKRRAEAAAIEAAAKKRQLQLRLAELKLKEEEQELKMLEEVVKSKEDRLRNPPKAYDGNESDAHHGDASSIPEPTTDFVCYHTDDGVAYYHNETTGETVWEPPPCWLEVHEGGMAAKPAPPGPFTADGLPDMRYMRNKLWYTRQGILPDDPRYGQLDTEEEDVLLPEHGYDVTDTAGYHRAPTPPPIRRRPVVSWSFGGRLVVYFPPRAPPPAEEQDSAADWDNNHQDWQGSDEVFDDSDAFGGTDAEAHGDADGGSQHNDDHGGRNQGDNDQNDDNELWDGQGQGPSATEAVAPTAAVSIYNTATLLANEMEFKVLSNGCPGPLDAAHNVAPDAVTDFCARMGTNWARNHADAILWRLLGLFCQHNGAVRTTGRVNQAQINNAATTDVVRMLGEYNDVAPGSAVAAGTALGEDSDKGGHDEGDDEALGWPEETAPPPPPSSSSVGQPAPSSTVDTAAALGRIQALLAQGYKQRACQQAMDASLWPHALVLSAKISPEYHKEVMLQFVRATMSLTPPMEILYSLYAGTVPTAAQMATSGTEHWPTTLSALLSNPTDGDVAAMREIGDARLSAGDVHGAHACFLCADEVPGSQWKESPRIVLVGGSKPHRMRRFMADLVSIQRTEIFEYAYRLKMGDEVAFTDFFVYKLVFVMWLCEAGRLTTALDYCESLVRLVTRTPPHAILRTFPRGFLHIVKDLVTRLRKSCGIVRGTADGDTVWTPTVRALLTSSASPSVSDDRGADPPMSVTDTHDPAWWEGQGTETNQANHEAYSGMGWGAGGGTGHEQEHEYNQGYTTQGVGGAGDPLSSMPVAYSQDYAAGASTNGHQPEYTNQGYAEQPGAAAGVDGYTYGDPGQTSAGVYDQGYDQGYGNQHEGVHQNQNQSTPYSEQSPGNYDAQGGGLYRGAYDDTSHQSAATYAGDTHTGSVGQQGGHFYSGNSSYADPQPSHGTSMDTTTTSEGNGGSDAYATHSQPRMWSDEPPHHDHNDMSRGGADPTSFDAPDHAGNAVTNGAATTTDAMDTAEHRNGGDDTTTRGPTSPSPEPVSDRDGMGAASTDAGAVVNPFAVPTGFSSPFQQPPGVSLPSLDAQPALPPMQLPPVSDSPSAVQNGGSQGGNDEPDAARAGDGTSASDGSLDKKPETSSSSSGSGGGWFSGLAKVFKPTTNANEMKLPEGSGYEWDEDLKAYAPTDPAERQEWLAERDRLAAPPPPVSGSTTPAAADANTPARAASGGPSTPRVGLTNPLDTLVTSSQPRTGRRGKRRSYAAGQGLSPAQRPSPLNSGPPSIPSLNN
eukprot:m.31219 g.31219  ORF g.31219 m.31219 type:complete len:1806 (-) comp4785_c0_seq1:73-5490(-)